MTTLIYNGGTVGWEAPELLQENGTTPTIESDIYALSMVFYEVSCPMIHSNEPKRTYDL